ncbi:hypothetical protein DIPPA_29666 [Diplonema papillatum]|nr:hypothetical protein DIPPA_29666 [Diplonema papillatum]|eukprot:gene1938-2945_t
MSLSTMSAPLLILFCVCLAAGDLSVNDAKRSVLAGPALRVWRKHRCMKPFDLLNYEPGSERQKCDFREIRIDEAELRLRPPSAESTGDEAGGIALEVWAKGASDDGTFSGTFEIEVENADLGTVAHYQRTDAGGSSVEVVAKDDVDSSSPGGEAGAPAARGSKRQFSFCCEFFGSAHCAPDAAGNTPPGAAITVCPTLTAGEEFEGSAVVHLPGSFVAARTAYKARMVVRANSGDVIGRVGFSFKLSPEVLEKLAAYRANESSRAQQPAEEL